MGDTESSLMGHLQPWQNAISFTCKGCVGFYVRFSELLLSQLLSAAALFIPCMCIGRRSIAD
jgi:hypothetical protein